MSDQYDEKAAELLDCYCYKHLEPFREHHATCPAYYRPAVAAALRAAVNAALDEAANLIDGVGKAEHNDAEKIRGLKIRP